MYQQERKRFNFDLISCLSHDVTQNVSSARETQGVFCSKIIVNNVAVAPDCAFWPLTMCAGHVSQLLIIKLWFINLFEKMSAHLRNSSFGFMAMN